MFLFSKPWLKRNFEGTHHFKMNVRYIIKHLDSFDKNKILGKSIFGHQEKWQSGKEKSVLERLDKGKNPRSFEPIRLVLHEKKQEFKLDDGISRLRAFHRRKIKNIKVELRVGDW
jgi:hypothetical protein